MSKQKFPTVYKVRVYDIDYLMNEELTESDLTSLFDTPSLNYSLIISMFNHIGLKMKNFEIIKRVKKDHRWMYETTWTHSQQREFENKVISVMKNVYNYGDFISLQRGQWWMTMYGFKVKGNDIDLEY